MMSKKRSRKRSLEPEDDEEIWKYLHLKIVEEKAFKEINYELWEEYIIDHDSPFTRRDLDEHYVRVMKESLYKMNLGPKMIFELYDKLKIEMTRHAEEMLERRYGAIIHLNKDRELKKFELMNTASVVNTPTVVLSPTIAKPLKKRAKDGNEEESVDLPDDINMSPAFEKKLWAYVDQFTATERPEIFTTTGFWKTFVMKEKLEMCSPSLLAKWFKKSLENLYKCDLDVTTKLNLMKKLKCFVSMEHRYWLLLHNRVEVKVDEDDCVEAWNELDKRVEEPTTSKTSDERQQMDQQPSARQEKEKEKGPPQVELTKTTSGLSTWTTMRRQMSEEREEEEEVIAPYQPDQWEDLEEDVKDVKPLFLRNWKGKMAYTEEEDLRIWNYLYRRVYNSEIDIPTGEEIKPKGFAVWKEYVTTEKTIRTAEQLGSHFRKQMLPKMWRENLEKMKMLRLYKYLRVAIPEEGVRSLERRFNVKLNLANNILQDWEDLPENEIVEEEEAVVQPEKEREKSSSPEIIENELNDTQPLSQEQEVVTIESDASDQTHQISEMSSGDEGDREIEEVTPRRRSPRKKRISTGRESEERSCRRSLRVQENKSYVESSSEEDEEEKKKREENRMKIRKIFSHRRLSRNRHQSGEIVSSHEEEEGEPKRRPFLKRNQQKVTTKCCRLTGNEEEEEESAEMTEQSAMLSQFMTPLTSPAKEKNKQRRETDESSLEPQAGSAIPSPAKRVSAAKMRRSMPAVPAAASSSTTSTKSVSSERRKTFSNPGPYWENDDEEVVEELENEGRRVTRRLLELYQKEKNKKKRGRVVRKEVEEKEKEEDPKNEREKNPKKGKDDEKKKVEEEPKEKRKRKDETDDREEEDPENGKKEDSKNDENDFEKLRTELCKELKEVQKNWDDHRIQDFVRIILEKNENIEKARKVADQLIHGQNDMKDDSILKQEAKEALAEILSGMPLIKQKKADDIIDRMVEECKARCWNQQSYTIYFEKMKPVFKNRLDRL